MGQSAFQRAKDRLSSVSWQDLVLALVPIALLTVAALWGAMRFIRPAVPSVLTLSTGPDGSSFQRFAERYAKTFDARGIILETRPSNGSLENLRRLADPESDVDVGFVQVGVKLPDPVPGEQRRNLVSLGTVSRQPLFILMRAGEAVTTLAELEGKRLVVGPEGSGTRVLSLALLKANGVEPGDGTLIFDLDDDLVGEYLEMNEVDAAFLMGDSASPKLIRGLIEKGNVQVVQLSQYEAYLRKFQDLDRVVVPMGAYDLGKNIPSTDLHLVASTVEVVAQAELHPALSDLLIETLRATHGRGSLLQKPGEFPAAREHELPISADARRYYDSGKRWPYRFLPFWAASLVDRFLVVLVPLVVVLIPGLRALPGAYRWRIRRRVYRVYATLMELERDVLRHAPDQRPELVKRLDAVEQQAEMLKLPLSFADQFYVLREHIGLVRRRLSALQGMATTPDSPAAGKVVGG